MEMGKYLRGFVLAGSLAMMAGCAAGVGYRVYDPYYTDYHVFDSGENVYYRNWINGNHRHYRDFRKLRPEDQHAYWTWRHERHK
jgi:hypothetical protein